MTSKKIKILSRIKSRFLLITDPIRYAKLHSSNDLSYAQAGEDRIINFLFSLLGNCYPKYLDIGANNPQKLSNTYWFYQNGSNGVCIEANPLLFEIFRKSRPRDIVLNVGIGPKSIDSMPFYCFDSEADGLSTFSEEQARRSEASHPYKVKEILQVPIVTINTILSEYFTDAPDFLSIDVEGLDRDILDSLDYSRFAPIVICAETHSREKDKFEKDTEFIEFIRGKGYVLFADTFINSIFLRKDHFDRVFKGNILKL